MPAGLTFNVYGNDVSASKVIHDVTSEAEGGAKKTASAWKTTAGIIGGALVAAKVKDFLSDSVREASDLQQNLGGAGAVFDKWSASVVTNSEKAATALGLSQNQYLESANKLGALLHGQGVASDQLGKATDDLIHKGADLAATFGGTTADAVEALTAAFKGETDPIERYGVSLKQSDISAQMAADGTDKLTGKAHKLAQQQAVLTLINQQTAASQGQFAAQTDTLAEKQQILSAKFDNIKASVGSAIIPLLSELAGVVTDDILPAFAGTVHWLESNWSWLKYVAGAVGTLWLAWKGYTIVKGAVVGISTAVNTLKTDFAAMKASSASALGGLKGGSAAGAAAVGGLALGVLGLGFAISQMIPDHVDEDLKKLAQRFTEGKESAGGWTQALKDSNGAITDSIRSTIAAQLQQDGLADKAAKAGVSLEAMTDAVVGNSQAFDALVASWQAGGDPSSVTIDQLRGLHEGFGKARSDAASLAAVTDTNTAAQGKQAGALDDTADAMDNQKTSADKLLASIKALSGDKINAAQAELKFRDGIAEATKQVHDNGKSLSVNTTAGRANREWLLDQISSLNGVAQAQLNAGAKTETVTAKMRTNEDALRRAARAAGFNKDEVNALIVKYGHVPTVKDTRINADASQANATIDNLITRIQGLGGTITIGARGTRGASANAQGSGFYRGGPTIVGEHGIEIVDPPPGSSIYTTSQSESMLGGGGGTPVVINIQTPVYSTAAEVGRALRDALDAAAAQGVKFTIAKAVV
jgi:hypothetical protein